MIGEKAGKYSLESELVTFQQKFTGKLGLLLTEEMDKWIRRMRNMIEEDPLLRDTIYTNLQLYNHSQVFDKTLFKWKLKFQEMLNGLLEVKGIVASIENKVDLAAIVNKIKMEDDELHFISILKK